MQNSARNSIGMLTSSPCQIITCVEVNEICQNFFRSSSGEVRNCSWARIFSCIPDDNFPIINFRRKISKQVIWKEVLIFSMNWKINFSILWFTTFALMCDDLSESYWSSLRGISKFNQWMPLGLTKLTSKIREKWWEKIHWKNIKEEN